MLLSLQIVTFFFTFVVHDMQPIFATEQCKRFYQQCGINFEAFSDVTNPPGNEIFEQKKLIEIKYWCLLAYLNKME